MQTFDSLESLFRIYQHRNRPTCDTEGVRSCHLVCSVVHNDPSHSFVMLFDILVYTQYQKELAATKKLCVNT